MAKKDLTQQEYQEWNTRFNEAATMITNRDERLDEIYAEMETGLTLVGSSAIEDRL